MPVRRGIGGTPAAGGATEMTPPAGLHSTRVITPAPTVL